VETEIFEDSRETLMDLSVVIVSYNVSSFLDQVLTTLKDSARDLDVEVFVTDNASSDNSVSMVREKHPWAKLIENEHNIGFAGGNNQALKKASGRFVLLLNPDTVLRHDTLKTMVRFLDEHPEAGIAGCKVLNPDGTLQLACRRGFPTPGVAFFKIVGLSDLFPGSRTFGGYNLTYLDPDSLTEVDAVSGSFMMIRKEALDKVGLLDETFFMYGEDLDICYRVKQAGWKIYYVPDTEIIHFKGESTKTVPTLKNRRDFFKAMHIFVDKHYAARNRLYPIWLLSAGIYIKMAWVYGHNMLIRLKQPILDLLLLNISLILGIFLRFGISLERAPDYSGLQWTSIFIVYSALYMLTFYFVGMYHRYRNNPERALSGIFIGFLFNIFIVNFIKDYNFSRIASFYCWGFNSILISGWRFVLGLVQSKEKEYAGRKTVVIGKISDAVLLRRIFSESCSYAFDIIGCVEVSQDAIRGMEKDGLYVLGLVDELNDIIKQYSIDVVIMVGSHIPFSKILNNGGVFGLMRPEFKFVPELNSVGEVKERQTDYVNLIDIHSGGMFGGKRR